MQILAEIAEYVRNLAALSKIVPPDQLVVAVLGTIFVGVVLGGGAGFLWGYFRNPKRTEKPTIDPPTEPPLPVPTCDCDHIKRLETELDKDADGIWRFHPTKLPMDTLKILHDGAMRVVVFLNQKGGVAKTTTTVNLAAYFARLGKRVLVIDLDYQASATGMLLQAAGLKNRLSAVDDVIATGNAATIKEAADLSSNLGSIDLLAAGVSSLSDLGRIG